MSEAEKQVFDEPTPPPAEEGLVAKAFRNYGLWAALTAGGLFLLALAVFSGLLPDDRTKVDRDQYSHIAVAVLMHKQAVPSGLRIAYPLYHYTVALALARSTDPEQRWPAARHCGIVVLALAIAIRGWLSFRELRGAYSGAGAALTCCLLLAAAMSAAELVAISVDYRGRDQSGCPLVRLSAHPSRRGQRQRLAQPDHDFRRTGLQSWRSTRRSFICRGRV